MMSNKNSTVHDKSHILEMLIESTKTSYVILDINGNILEVNDHMINLLGCSDEKNLIGKSPKQFISELDYNKYDSSISRLLKGENIDNVEFNLSVKNSFIPKASWVRISAGLMENGTKKIFCIISDITKAKNEEMKKYIDTQKKRHKIRQTIVGIREPIKNELKLGR
jgi:PAS domain S-box-containing protein